MAKTIRANGNDLVKQDHLLFNELNEDKMCVFERIWYLKIIAEIFKVRCPRNRPIKAF